MVLLVACATPASAVPGMWTLTGFAWEPAPEGGRGRYGLPNAFALHAMVPPAGSARAAVELAPGGQIQGYWAYALDVRFEGAGCDVGVPRLELAVDRDGDGVVDATVYARGGAGSYGEGCVPAGRWVQTDLTTGLRWDATQLGGPAYTDVRGAGAAAGAGHHVLHASFSFGPSESVADNLSVWFDNLRIASITHGEPGLDHACSLLAYDFSCWAE